MSELAQSVERLAAAVVLADANDPPEILRLHDGFKAVRESMPSEMATATEAASQAEALLQRIVLLEEADTQAALRRVGTLVAEIQHALDGTAPAPTVVPAEPAATSTAADAPATAADENAGGSPFREEDLPLVLDFVTESREHLEAAEAEALKLDGAGDPEAINAIFRSFHTIKGVAGFLNLREIGLLAHAAETLLDQARTGKLTLGRSAIELILQSIDTAKAMLGAIDKAARANGAPANHPGLAALRTRLEECAAGKGQADSPAPAATESTTAAPAAAPSHGPSSSKSADATVKVATNRLDSLINMVGELVITQSMVRQDTRGLTGTSQTLARNLSRLDKITRELQDLSMSMRMVPIQGVFQKMTRLVRDLAGKFGKQIDLSIVGGDTELDRNVVEAIADPLVHMVRNAADHGIEPPDVRVKSGKSAAGRIELKACHLAGQVVIEIRDNGKGLSKQRILKKAMDAGIVKPNEQLSDADIHRLIFHPGLSTAEKITDVSGRGVGMDVVKKNIEALRGHVDIHSTEGEGSTFTIRLPLTLAVIDGLLVRVGPERFIIPILSVEQSIRPEASQISTVQGRGELCMVRGRPLRLFRLHRLFNVTPVTDDPSKGLVVIVRDNGREAALLVDELIGQQQVVIKSLGDGLSNVRGFSGGAIIGDGTVSLIVDVPGVIDLATGLTQGEEH